MPRSDASRRYDKRRYDEDPEWRAWVLRRNAQYRRSLGYSWLWKNNRPLAWRLIRRWRHRKRWERIESGDLVFQKNGIAEPKPPEGGLLRVRRFR